MIVRLADLDGNATTDLSAFLLRGEDIAMRYNGRIRANVIADSSVFPDENNVSTLIEEFEKEFLLLGKSIGLKDQDCFTENVNNNLDGWTSTSDKTYFLKTKPSVSEMIHLS